MKKRYSTIQGITDGLAAGLAIATGLGFFGRLFWMCDLFSHFRVQYVQIGLALIFIALWKRRNKRAVALVLLVSLNYAFVLPLYFGKPDASTKKPMRAMLMNLNAGNGNTKQVLGSIEKVDPDIVLFEEVTPKWARELDALKGNYPYRVAQPQEGCFGIMLLSKFPLEHGEVVQIGAAGVPSIVAEAYFPQGVIAIIGTHPLPPIGAAASLQRNIQLAALPRVVHQQKHPVLLIGDLNCSPWSSHFRQLLTDSGLENSMQGFGHQPSWPVNHFFLRIPLDHVLHSPDITIHNRAVIQGVGSDHFPVIVDFSVN